MSGMTVAYGNAGEMVDGYTLGEWLEDSATGRFSRYAVDGEEGDSIWVCTECLHVETDCECEDADEVQGGHPSWY